DITGPSIPSLFGIKGKADANELGIFPFSSKIGVKIISLNLLLEHNTDPVVWRGPVIAATVKQFWSDVIWDDVDFMFVDMPPGTGDVPLTVFQSLPVDGLIVVSSPQELVGLIVEKAIKMANMMNVPILAFVENMSYFKCDKCEKTHYLFGESKIDDFASRYGVDTVAKIPLDPEVAHLCDMGKVENTNIPALYGVVNKLLSME
ncbi:MAG TPA: P-loop NTPase, partial [Clostridia bacterium]|nr:P-loop NTPase [Clostridia bacterium]